MSSFFRELKQRKVYRVALGYAVIAWLVVQVSATVMPSCHAPEWILPSFITVIALGFPVALVLAWAFELKGGIIEKAPEPTSTLSAANKRRVWLLGAVGLIISALAVGVYWMISYLLRNASTAKSITAPPAVVEKSIPVLPFENLSEEKANAYFAEGIKNEILIRLATVRDLKVISRTSTAKYQSKPDNLKTVAQELGVSTILEGAVQKAGDKVRINAQLIDARADRHLWGKSYDRDFKDVLGVESEVSQEIAEALQANLSPSESHALASVGTHDAEAYDLFLRGEYELHHAQSSPAADAFDRADAFYRQALARDPNFAEAAAELARSRLSRHWLVSPLTVTQLEEVKSLIDHALALVPNSPEAHFALGLFFYFGHRQYELALAALVYVAMWDLSLVFGLISTSSKDGLPMLFKLSRSRWATTIVGIFSSLPGVSPFACLQDKLRQPNPREKKCCRYSKPDSESGRMTPSR
jgi:TolB-like protein